MSRTVGQPSQDLPEPVLPGYDDDAIGMPDGEPGFGNDVPNPSERESPLGEPDPTRPDTRETATEEINRRKGDQPNHGLLSDYDEGRPAPSLGSID